MYVEELDHCILLQISVIDLFLNSKAEAATDLTEWNLVFETDAELSPCTTMPLNRCIISARSNSFLFESIYDRSGRVFSRPNNE